MTQKMSVAQKMYNRLKRAERRDMNGKLRPMSNDDRTSWTSGNERKPRKPSDVGLPAT
jgi:hypothetical protein